MNVFLVIIVCLLLVAGVSIHNLNSVRVVVIQNTSSPQPVPVILMVHLLKYVVVMEEHVNV